jgi:hypothetical protein
LRRATIACGRALRGSLGWRVALGRTRGLPGAWWGSLGWSLRRLLLGLLPLLGLLGLLGLLRWPAIAGRRTALGRTALGWTRRLPCVWGRTTLRWTRWRTTRGSSIALLRLLAAVRQLRLVAGGRATGAGGRAAGKVALSHRLLCSCCGCCAHGGSGLGVLVVSEKALQDDGRLLVIGQAHERPLELFEGLHLWRDDQEMGLVELHEKPIEDCLTEASESGLIAGCVRYVEECRHLASFPVQLDEGLLGLLFDHTGDDLCVETSMTRVDVLAYRAGELWLEDSPSLLDEPFEPSPPKVYLVGLLWSLVFSQ